MKEVWIDPEIIPPINNIEYMYKGYECYDMQNLVKDVGIIKQHQNSKKYYVGDSLFNIFNTDVYAYRIR